jgi:hypothetical protein
MPTAPAARKREDQKAVAFIAQVIRLERQVDQINRQLDRIESEMRSRINELSRQRFEEYR